MHVRRKVLVLGAAAAFLGACGLVGRWFGAGGGPAFSHVEHAEKGATCADCHGEAPEKEKPILPAMAVCAECHDDLDKDKPPERRATAFVSEGRTEPAWKRVSALDGEVIFDHALHVGKKVACAECHAGIDASVAVTSDLAVSMEACMKCHAQKAVAHNECASCHRERRHDREPPGHRTLWAQQHGAVARAGGLDASRCALCHTEQGCNECHQAHAPRDHTATWRHQTHGIAVAMDRNRCQVCHQTDSCDRCHREAAPRSHVGSFAGTAGNHCYSCHGLSPAEGCAVCHRGTPSHALAAPKPAWHLPGMNCRQCHTPSAPPDQRLAHADNGMDCNICHK